jgi:hypothetical protein
MKGKPKGSVKDSIHKRSEIKMQVVLKKDIVSLVCLQKPKWRKKNLRDTFLFWQK